MSSYSDDVADRLQRAGDRMANAGFPDEERQYRNAAASIRAGLSRAQTEELERRLLIEPQAGTLHDVSALAGSGEYDSTGESGDEIGSAGPDQTPDFGIGESSANELLSTVFAPGLSDPYSSYQAGWTTGPQDFDPYSAVPGGSGVNPFTALQNDDPVTSEPADSTTANFFTTGQNVAPDTGSQNTESFTGGGAPTDSPSQTASGWDLVGYAGRSPSMLADPNLQALNDVVPVNLNVASDAGVPAVVHINGYDYILTVDSNGNWTLDPGPTVENKPKIMVFSSVQVDQVEMTAADIQAAREPSQPPQPSVAALPSPAPLPPLPATPSAPSTDQTGVPTASPQAAPSAPPPSPPPDPQSALATGPGQTSQLSSPPGGGPPGPSGWFDSKFGPASPAGQWLAHSDWTSFLQDDRVLSDVQLGIGAVTVGAMSFATGGVAGALTAGYLGGGAAAFEGVVLIGAAESIAGGATFRYSTAALAGQFGAPVTIGSAAQAAFDPEAVGTDALAGSAFGAAGYGAARLGEALGSGESGGLGAALRDFHNDTRGAIRSDFGLLGPEVPRSTQTNVDEAVANYQAKNPGADLAWVSQDGFHYVFDVATDRLVAMHGKSAEPLGPRDTSRMAGHPNSFGVDRGHMAPHSAGGGTDINLVPQDPRLNRGWSTDGRVWRGTERYLAATPGTEFSIGLEYDGASQYPSRFHYEWETNGNLQSQTFENPPPKPK